jgi:hypothetical protein
MDLSRLTVVIFAGGKLDRKFQKKTGRFYSHQLVIRGKTLLNITLDAIWEAGLATEQKRPHLIADDVHVSKHYHIIEPGETLSSNVYDTLKKATIEFVLFVAVDMCDLNAEALRHLMSLIELWLETPDSIDVFYPVTHITSCTRKYPSIKLTALPFKGEKLTGGNVFFLRRESILKHWDLIIKAINARKRPLKLAKLFGSDIVKRLIYSKIGAKLGIDKYHLSVSELEQAALEKIGLRCKVLRGKGHELGLDIDNLKRYEAVQ